MQISNVLYTVTHGEMGGVHRFLDSILFHHSARFRPVVLSFSDGPWLASLRERGITVYCIEGARFRQPYRCFTQVRAIIKKERIAIVHSSYAWSHALVAPAAAFSGCALIWFHHGPISNARWQGIYSLFPANLLLTNSHYMHSKIRHTLHAAKRTGVVHYGIDADVLVPDAERRAAFRKAWALDDATIAVGLVGFIDTWKGQDVFLEAIRLLAPASPRAHFFIIGGPRDGLPGARCQSFERKLHQFVRDNHLEQLVTFTGHVDITKGALDGLDVFVHASTEPDPFPSAILEAMAKGRAIIASAEGGPCEMLEHEVDGLLIQPRAPEILAEAIGRLLREAAFRESLGHAARHSAETRLGAKRPAELLESWYDRILHGCEAGAIQATERCD